MIDYLEGFSQTKDPSETEIIYSEAFQAWLKDCPCSFQVGAIDGHGTFARINFWVEQDEGADDE